MAIDSGTFNTRIIDSSTSNVTLNSTSSWSTVLSTSNFTTGCLGWIRADLSLVHAYEAGAVNAKCRFLLNDSNHSDEIQVFTQGIGGNKAFGAHNASWTWYNVGAGTYHVDVQMINIAGSTTGITCYFHNGDTSLPDKLMVTYQA